MRTFAVDKRTVVCFSVYFIAIVEIALILPCQIKGYVRLRSQSTALNEKISHFNRDVESEGAFLEEKENAGVDIFNIEAKMITSQDISTVSAYISKKAKENNVNISQIIPAALQEYKKTSEGTFSYLPLRIDARAGFHSLAQFLNVLEVGEYFLHTKKLAIQGDKPYHQVDFVIDILVKE